MPLTALAVLLLMVTLGVLGIVRGRREVVFISKPGAAELFVDDRRAGTTPITIRLRPGKYSVQMHKQGYRTVRAEIAIPDNTASNNIYVDGRVVGAVLAPDSPESEEYYRRVRRRVHRWALTGVASSNYQKPPVFTLGVQELASQEAGGLTARLLVSGTADLVDAYILGDWLQGAVQHRSAGGVPATVDSLLYGIGLAYRRFSANDEAIAYIQDIPGLPKSQQWTERISASEWAEQRTSRVLADNRSDSTGASGGGGGSIRIKDMVFVPVPTPPEVGAARKYQRLYISETIITNQQFLDFISAEDAWHYANRETLQAQGLVDSRYLAALEAGGAGARPGAEITHVSWHAATAYTDWLTRQLPAERQGFTVQLPTNDELSAAENQIEFADSTNWVWTVSPLHPARNFLQFPSGDPALAGGDIPRIVRGRDGDDAPGIQAGVQPADISSPILSFRPILVQK